MPEDDLLILATRNCTASRASFGQAAVVHLQTIPGGAAETKAASVSHGRWKRPVFVSRTDGLFGAAGGEAAAA
jgi:hypothetical protein